MNTDPTETAIVKLLENQTIWTGTPSGLLTELKAIGGAGAVQSSKGLANALTRLSPRLTEIGIAIKRTKSGDRKITITRAEPSEPSEPLEPLKTFTGGFLDGYIKPLPKPPYLPLIKCRDCEHWYCWADYKQKGIGSGYCKVGDDFTRWSESLHTCELFEEKKR